MNVVGRKCGLLDFFDCFADAVEAVIFLFGYRPERITTDEVVCGNFDFLVCKAGYLSLAVAVFDREQSGAQRADFSRDGRRAYIEQGGDSAGADAVVEIQFHYQPVSARQQIDTIAKQVYGAASGDIPVTVLCRSQGYSRSHRLCLSLPSRSYCYGNTTGDFKYQLICSIYI